MSYISQSHIRKSVVNKPVCNNQQGFSVICWISCLLSIEWNGNNIFYICLILFRNMMPQFFLNFFDMIRYIHEVLHWSELYIFSNWSVLVKQIVCWRKKVALAARIPVLRGPKVLFWHCFGLSISLLMFNN